MAATFEDAVDDGFGEVVVVEHGAQRLGCLFVVETIARFLMCRASTTWKRTFAASVPYAR